MNKEGKTKIESKVKSSAQSKPVSLVYVGEICILQIRMNEVTAGLQEE